MSHMFNYTILQIAPRFTAKIKCVYCAGSIPNAHLSVRRATCRRPWARRSGRAAASVASGRRSLPRTRSYCNKQPQCALASDEHQQRTYIRLLHAVQFKICSSTLVHMVMHWSVARRVHSHGDLSQFHSVDLQAAVMINWAWPSSTSVTWPWASAIVTCIEWARTSVVSLVTVSIAARNTPGLNQYTHNCCQYTTHYQITTHMYFKYIETHTDQAKFPRSSHKFLIHVRMFISHFHSVCCSWHRTWNRSHKSGDHNNLCRVAHSTQTWKTSAHLQCVPLEHTHEMPRV